MEKMFALEHGGFTMQKKETKRRLSYDTSGPDLQNPLENHSKSWRV